MSLPIELATDNVRTMKTESSRVFRFSVEHPGAHRVVVELDCDSTLENVIDTFEAFLLAAGFDPKNVHKQLDPIYTALSKEDLSQDWEWCPEGDYFILDSYAKLSWYNDRRDPTGWTPKIGDTISIRPIGGWKS